jgi:AraC-like DNA-binding protein
VTREDKRRLPLYTAGQIDVPFVIAGHSEAIDRDTSWEEHSHPTHELLWNEAGASRAVVGTRIYTVTPSIGLWIPAGTPHSGWCPAGTLQRAAHFSVRTVPSISDEPVAVDVSPLLRMLLDRVDDESLEKGSRATAETMVLDVLEPAPRELLLRMPTSPALQPIVDAVQGDPADATTLAQWASRLGVSTRTITRLFIAETGLGFARWITTARIQHAIGVLSEESDIDEVAHRVGYASSSAFGTAFRRVTGLSPGRFRAQ